MKILVLLLLLLFLPGGGTGVFAAITERVIYAGDTPLASDCQVTQTGFMELTVMPCFWTTTGEAKILGPIASFVAATGIGLVAQALREGKAEWHHNRVRVWFRDKHGNIIERSVTYQVGQGSADHNSRTEVQSLHVDGPGNTMTIFLMDPIDPLPFGFINYLIFKFDVPFGTIDLSTVTLEVFTVRPHFPPAKSLFEK
ncbi:hypothetical protein LCGC14_1899480 [marine sediment metagenome]|uniref:Uncharacterized protein n=1 Tax=marine sediment metagenome TaxID=412755 RepID=A0A0F9GKE6_9ZZZZ